MEVRGKSMKGSRVVVVPAIQVDLEECAVVVMDFLRIPEVIKSTQTVSLKSLVMHETHTT